MTGYGARAGAVEALWARLDRPISGAWLSWLRRLFGALMLLSTLRFVLRGWVAELYLEPSYHFTYLGFGWVKPLPAPLLYAVFGVLGLSALAQALGYRTRLAALVFFIGFSYVELLEQAAYLNHYYLVSLLALLFACLPTGRVVPAWTQLLLRVQVGLVYFYAGLAKLNPDWLLYAEPLAGWLHARQGTPLVGPLLALPMTATLMSWAGAAYDLTLPLWLSLRRTRALAFTACIGFHAIVGLLFPIGVFPWLMVLVVTVFFPPAWPQALGASRLVQRLLGPSASSVKEADEKQAALAAPAVNEADERAPAPTPRLVLALAALYLAAQALVPLRSWLTPGSSHWHEEGFRFAWRVMLIEKTARLEYDVKLPSGASYRVVPERELTRLQYQMLSTQPDMILQYAHHLADEARAREGEQARARGGDEGQQHEPSATRQGDVQVFARSWAALNGRPSQALVDPTVDLARVSRFTRAHRYVVPLGELTPRAVD